MLFTGFHPSLQKWFSHCIF